MEIMPGFTLTEIETSGAQIRLRHGGNGPPLLLLHGNPLTHVSWHAVAPRLAERFHVIAADLRGYGDSSAPPEEPDSSNYSFRAMAQDQVEVMRALGYDRFYVAGHDRGGRTVHRMCLDHPDKVIKAAIIDIVPTLDMWAAMNKEAAISGWHWPLMAQPADFPERMLGGVDPDWFMRKKLLKLTADLNHIPPAIWNEYVRCFSEKTIRGSCGDYRAAARSTATSTPPISAANCICRSWCCGARAAALASVSPIRSACGDSAPRMCAAKRCRPAIMSTRKLPTRCSIGSYASLQLRRAWLIDDKEFRTRSG